MLERVTANKIANVLMPCSSRIPPDQYSASYCVCGPVVAARCSGIGSSKARPHPLSAISDASLFTATYRGSMMSSLSKLIWVDKDIF